jgi:hypothetical protein
MTTSERIAGRTMAPPRRTLPCYLITSGGKIVLWIGNLWSRLRTVSAEAAAMAMRKASKSEVDYSRGHAGAHCGKALDDDKAYCRYFISAIVAREQSRPMREGRWPDQ